MPEEFTDAERRLAKAVGITPEEARKLFQKAQEKIKRENDLDFTTKKTQRTPL